MADSRENPEALNALVRLMQNLDDPSGLTDDQLVRAAAEAKEAKKLAELAAATELACRGWSWRKIGDHLAVNYSTAYGWVRDAGRLPEVAARVAALRAERDTSES